MGSRKKWFPYMKGGVFKRLYGNQEYLLYWYKNGVEIKYLNNESGCVSSRPQNTNFYFRCGLTFNRIFSSIFSVRIMPTPVSYLTVTVLLSFI